MTGLTSKDAGGKRRHWWRSLTFLTFALLALALSGGSGYSAQHNVHGAVYSWAREHPGEPVPVLIQTESEASTVAGFIESSGGEVSRQFNVISAVEASVPASFVATLAAQPGVAWVSLDAPVASTGAVVDLKKLATTYPLSVGADDPWSKGYSGAGIGVAVVDTGISPANHPDFVDSSGRSRVVAQVVVNPSTTNTVDGYGHGTHIAGIVGGDGDLLSGKYVGIAPRANLIEVKAADDQGNSSLGDVVAGLEWVYNNRATYNIRVVNLSLHSSVAESYKTSPLDAAVETLWFNGIFVVVASGNEGGVSGAVSYPPANDPFVMTVGAIDDMGTTAFADDVPASWSSFGATQDGFTKPELLTPGRNIISVIDTNSILYKTLPDHIVDSKYFRLSGTSMAAGVMSGVGALVLQRHPDWTPGQLKCSLIATSRQLSSPNSAFKVPKAGDVSNLSAAKCNSDVGLAPSTALAPMLKAAVIAFVLDQPSPSTTASAIGMDLAAAGLQNATLATVDWSAIKWNSITWSAIKWSAIKWDAIKWDAIKWDAIKWSLVSPDGVNFSAIKWDAIKWSAIKWDAIKWSAIKWDAIKWDAIKWDAIKWDVRLD